MYEVSLICDASNPAHRRSLPRGLSFGPVKGFKMEPSVELCDWLTIHAPSLLSIEILYRGSAVRDSTRSPLGLCFAFASSSEAVLFKLTWG